MSNENLPAPYRPQTSLAPIDPWGNAMGGAMPPSPQPLKVVHRSLRGRYFITAALALAGLIGGAVIGWNSKDKTYRAVGDITIEPTIRAVTALDRDYQTIPYYTQYMVTQAQNLQSERYAEYAQSRPAWQEAAGKPKTVEEARRQRNQLLGNIRATYLTNSSIIRVTFENSDEKLALAGMNAILQAYKDLRQEELGGDIEKQLTDTDGIIQSLESQIRDGQDQILLINRRYLTDDLKEEMSSMNGRVTSLQLQLDRQQTLLQLFYAARDAAKSAGPADAPANPREFVGMDPSLDNLIARRDEEQLNLNALVRGGAMENSPQVQKSKNAIANYDARIKELVDALSANVLGRVPSPEGGEFIVVTPQRITLVEAYVSNLKSQIADIQKEATQLSEAKYKMETLRNKMQANQSTLLKEQARREKLALAGTTTGASVRTDPSSIVTPVDDRRAVMAVVFGFGGALLPTLAMLLFGLSDRRFRYSDEAQSPNKGLTLLGILPNLPDRLSDPSQASVAAHCVHQIRTMLQLNVISDDPSCLAITSATSGDGKTSLSLALGLSFAASGSRTLLIDTDLVGAGLSARLGVNDPEGVLEALGHRDPMVYVRDTDVQDLSILPVGSAAVNHAGTISPAAMRRLVGDAKKHFDIIIIDTGPLLGSIEATPVCAAADATIITVRRGQNRDLVDKAVNHLRSIGARLAGVVFNRAATADFERSISGISLRSASRSQSNGTGHNTSPNGNGHSAPLGPVDRAVRSSVIRD